MEKQKFQTTLLSVSVVLLGFVASCTEQKDSRVDTKVGDKGSLSSEQKSSSSSGRPTDSSEGLPGYFIICSFLNNESEVVVGTTDRAGCRLQKGDEAREEMLSLSADSKWNLFNADQIEKGKVNLYQSSLFEWDIEVQLDEIGADQWGSIFGDLLIELTYTDENNEAVQSLTTVYESNDDLKVETSKFDQQTVAIESYVKFFARDKRAMDLTIQRLSFIPGLSSKVTMLRNLVFFTKNLDTVRYNNTMNGIDKTIKSLSDSQKRELQKVIPSS